MRLLADFKGRVPPDTDNQIDIRVGLDRADLIETIARELRHIWQLRKFGRDYIEGQAGEQDAEQYGRQAMAIRAGSHEKRG